MSAIHITLEKTETKGRYVATVEGIKAVAELTYSIASPSLIIVDHTGVPDALRGKGIGLALSQKVVVDARTNGVSIVPLCPFFKAMSQRNPDWADVVQ
jgi:predicted GNAT family acetyltransferase